MFEESTKLLEIRIYSVSLLSNTLSSVEKSEFLLMLKNSDSIVTVSPGPIGGIGSPLTSMMTIFSPSFMIVKVSGSKVIISPLFSVVVPIVPSSAVN